MFWCLLGLAGGDPAMPCDYFEYSSTISASLMSAGRSPRSGTALNTPLNLFESTSTHDGDRSIVEDTVSASFTRSCFWARSDRAIASPALTWYEGRLTGLPLTVMPRCETSWRAAGRVTAKPMSSEEHTSELQSLMRLSYAVFCMNKKHRTLKLHAH